LTLSLLALSGPAQAQHKDVERPAHWKDLVLGGRFMDRFEPMPLLSERTADTWGVDAVKPRDVKNGIEEAEWSYWGGNVVRGDDGKFHMLVCRWPESHPKGHMAWGGSEVVRATATNRFGPYTAQQVLGKGHNPEVYRLADGRYVCYVIGSYYVADVLEGPWAKHKYRFDPRGRRIVEGLSNLSFVRREDGSFLMVCRGGGMWASRTGLGPWEQFTQGSNYPKVRGRFEDPVIWKTEVQYHMIVNDWHGRIAYHLRSKDGLRWKVDPGEAYQPGIAVSADGKKDDWYKYERIKVFQDAHGRAIQTNFAVIDYSKWEDKANDIHSSKNISIPLTKGRLLTLLVRKMPGAAAKEIRVRIAAEPDFDPHADLAPNTLRFGAPEEVDFGRGCRLLKTERQGADLIAVFDAAGHGFDDDDFAGKLLGRTAGGKLLFGYCRLPWVSYGQAMLSAQRTVEQRRLADGSRSLATEVKNYGLTASRATRVELLLLRDGKTTCTAKADLPALAPWASHKVEWTVSADAVKGAPSWKGRVVIDPAGSASSLDIELKINAR